MPEPQREIDTLRAYTDAAIEHAAGVAAISLAAAEKLTGQRFEDQQIAVAAAFAAQKEAIAAALAAQEKAVAKAELAAERRFDNVNEFRGQLADQASTFMSRAEALLQMKANADKIDALATRIDRTEGRSSGMNAGWAILMGAVATLGVIVTLLLRLH
jgi:hypothetical protein